MGRPTRHHSEPPPPEDAPDKSYALYLIAALLLFGFQVLFATTGALETVFRDLRLPIPTNAGRSIHLNLSLYWPFLGIIGGIYSFVPLEMGVRLYSPKLALVQFWLLLAVILAILGSLALGLTEGREYLEAPRPLLGGLLLGFGLFIFNVVQTIRKARLPSWPSTMVAIVAGLLLSLLFFAPTIIPYPGIVADELSKFWVVHVWVESTLELIVAGLLAVMLVQVTGMDRQTATRLLYLEGFFIVISGLFGIGHHYFWIGVPKLWLYLGGIFGALQTVPVLFLASIAYKGAAENQDLGTEAVGLKFLLSAAAWNFFGAGLIGLITTIPAVNAYTHGTLLTSGHAHMALFGTYGFLALGIAYLTLPEWRDGALTAQKGLWSLRLLNVGLAVMGGALALAGVAEAYLLRVVGLDFPTVVKITRPYMAVRIAGAVIFATGALLPAFDVFFRGLLGKGRKPSTSVP